VAEPDELAYTTPQAWAHLERFALRWQMVQEERYQIRLNFYFAQEVLLMLDDAGFHDLAVEGGYTGRPATSDDGMVAFMARK